MTIIIKPALVLRSSRVSYNNNNSKRQIRHQQQDTCCQCHYSSCIDLHRQPHRNRHCCHSSYAKMPYFNMMMLLFLMIMIMTMTTKVSAFQQQQHHRISSTVQFPTTNKRWIMPQQQPSIPSVLFQLNQQHHSSHVSVHCHYYYQSQSSLASAASSSSSSSDFTSTSYENQVETPSTSTDSTNTDSTKTRNLTSFQSTLTRIGLVSYIIAMCIALPITLLPQLVLYKLKLVSRVQKEQMALKTSKFCARWLLRFIPFCSIQVITDTVPPITSTSTSSPTTSTDIPAKIWVSNHISMIDVFIMLAVDKELRGVQDSQRPIKIIYWKTLENNIITKLMFTMAGFIPVAMSPNAPGEDNQYDKKSFKILLKSCKQAFNDGFDVGILPEGQLNPTPEHGLLPIFSGAYTLAKLSNRPIQMIALYNLQNIWHPINGMICTQRHVKVRCYSTYRTYTSSNDFITTFNTVVGHFCKTGTDLHNATDYLLSSAT